MIGKKLLSSRIVPVFEVRDLVKERLEGNEKGIEPTYEQNMVLEYCKRFSGLSSVKSKKLLEELKAIDGFNVFLAVKTVDILPEDLDELNLLVSKNDSVSEASLKQALELVKKFKS